MKRLFYFLIIFLLTGIAMYFTNPPAIKHEEAVYNSVREIISEEYDSSALVGIKDIDIGLVESLAKNTVADMVIVANYRFFSVTKVQWAAQQIPIGLGVGGKVFLASAFKEKIRAELRKYKP